MASPLSSLPPGFVLETPPDSARPARPKAPAPPPGFVLEQQPPTFETVPSVPLRRQQETAPPPGFVLKQEKEPAALGVGDYASEFGGATVRGAAGTTAGMLRGANVLTTDSPDEIRRAEDGISRLKTMTAEQATEFMRSLPARLSPAVAFNYQVAIRKLWDGKTDEAKSYLDQARRYTDTRPIEQQGLSKAAANIEGAANEAFPQDPRFRGSVTSDLGQGFGSTAAFLPIGLLTGGTGVAVAGAAAGADQGYQEAIRDLAAQRREDRGEAYNSGLGAEAQVKALQAGRLSALPGVSEVVPVETFIQQAPRFIPGLRPIANSPAFKRFAKAFGRIGTQVLAEGGQEAFQTWAGNVINQITVDPSQALDENVLYNFAIGGAVGGGMQAAMEGYGATRGTGEPPPPSAPPPPRNRTEPRLFPDDPPGPQAGPATPPPQQAAPQADQPAPAPSAPSAPPAPPPGFVLEDAPPSGIDPGDEGYLLGAGYTPEQIADMNVPERAAAVQEARQQGATPVTPSAAPPPPGTAPRAPRGTRQAKATIETAQDLEPVRPVVNPEPSEAQARAGNYQKAHVRIHGLDVSIENPRGSIRRGRDEDGRDWASPELPADYGYIKRTTGKDGDHVDVYIGPSPESDRVFVIDQLNLKTGKFDEHKSVLGASSLGQAVDLYVNSFDNPTLKRIGDVTEMSVDEFRQWVKEGRNTKRPAAKAGIGTVTPNPPEAPSEIAGAPDAMQAAGQMPVAAPQQEPGSLPNSVSNPADSTFQAPFDQFSSETEFPVIQAELPDQPQIPAPQQDAPRYNPTTISGEVDGALKRYLGGTGPLTPEAFAKFAKIDVSEAGKALQYAGLRGGIIIDKNGNWRRPRTFKGPANVLDFIASIGGIRDVTGELRGMDLPKMTQFGPVVRKKGLHPDRVREQLIEAGYLFEPGRGTDRQQQTTVADVYDLISQHMSGLQVVAAEDQAEAEAIRVQKLNENMPDDWQPQNQVRARFGAEVWSDIEEFFARSGTTEESWGPDELRNAARLIAGGMEPDDAFERAAIQYHATLEDTEGLDPALEAAFQNGNPNVMVAFEDVPFPDLETATNADQQQGPQETGDGAGPAGTDRLDGAGQAVDADTAEEVRSPGARGGQEGGRGQDAGPVSPAAEPGADGRPQLVIPGAEQDVRGAMQNAAKAPLKSNSPQKGMDIGMFGSERDQTDIFDKRPEEVDPAASSPKPETYGDSNKFVTKDRAAELREKLKAKLKNQVSSGIDPEMLALGAELAAYHIEAGARRFSDFARVIAADLGATIKQVRPYLRSWYNGARDMMEDAGLDVAGMDSPDEVRAALAALDGQNDNGSAIQNNGKPQLALQQDEKFHPLVTAFVNYFSQPDAAFDTITEARKFAAERGFVANPGTAEAKDLDEKVELAIVLTARTIIGASKARPAKTAYRRLVDLYNRQPNLGVRTSESMADQAYSTPAPLAFIASRLAGVPGAKDVLEPTAGNGMLLIEASPSRATVNEINDRRAEALKAQGFRVTQKDAATGSLRKSDYPVDSVIANPPFGAVKESDGSSKTFDVDGWTTTQIDHAIALNTLKTMKDDGRAVLIVGSVKEGSEKSRSDGYNTKQKREFYWRLYQGYNVTDHFTVAGDLYKRQGAAWPVDVIVIDGRSKSARPLPAVELPKVYDTWESLEEKLNEAPAQSETATGPAVAGNEVSRPSGVGNVSEAGTELEAGSRPNQRPDGAGRPASPQSAVGGQGTVFDGGVQREPDGVGKQQSPEPDRGQMAPGKRPDGDGGRKAPVSGRERVAQDAESAQQPYRPMSGQTSLDTKIPTNMAAAVEESLQDLADRHGDLDAWLENELGYKKGQIGKYLAAEQVDAVALALDNVKKEAAFIIGDQTGIGKGRVVAAALRYAMRQGLVPIFVTEKPNLYGDIIRDLNDIGVQEMLGRDLRPFLTNSGESIPLDDEAVAWYDEAQRAKVEGQPSPPKRGKFLRASGGDLHKRQMAALQQEGTGKDFDIIFTTYDQMNTVKGQTTDRRRLVDGLAGRAFIVLDESHNAGGTEPNERGPKNAPESRSDFLKNVTTKAKAVMFSSATYAKRPGVMALYARTDMGKAVDKPSMLGDLIAKGGVPMQQVVASMLAKAGQYIRRERSFDGVSYDVEPVTVDLKAYEAVSTSLAAIARFDIELKKSDVWSDVKEGLKGQAEAAAMDPGTGEASVNSTNFTSLMHNIVNQMLLAIKVNAVADRAIQALRENEKPVITVANTMGAFLKSYAEDNDIKAGNGVTLSFRDVLLRYLERTLRLTVKRPDGTKYHVQIPLSALPPRMQKAYEDARNQVDQIDTANLPISPIDWLRHRLARAGYRVGEITGRKEILDYAGPDNASFALRSDSEVSPAGRRVTIDKYNRGDLDAMILNRAGSTGLSLHASSKFKDRRRRRMIIAQAELNIDVHMQMLGRVHRTGQVVPPAFVQAYADVPAEARPAAVLAKKMASLNANTTASRKSAFSADDGVDFLNEYGDQVAREFLAENPDFNQLLDVSLDPEKETARELTGRLLLLPVADQRRVIDEITARYKTLIANLDAMGENALEAKTVDLSAKTVGRQVLRPSEGESPFTQSVILEEVEVRSDGKALPMPEIVNKAAEALGAGKVSTDNPESALNEIARTADKVRQTFAKKWLDDFDRMVADELKNTKSDDVRSERREKHTANRQRFNDLLDVVMPGRRVTVRRATEDGEPIIGIVMNVARRGQTGATGNPLALGAWTAEIAIADNAQRMQIPFSSMIISGEAYEASRARIIVGAPDWAMGIKQTVEAFDRARQTGKERRHIVTGNILAGFDQTSGRGQIINYTDNEGNVKPGILMARNFDPAAFLKERAVRFKSADQVIAFLKQLPAAEIMSHDNVITVRASGTSYEIEMPASRQTGGIYFLNPEVRRSARDQFTKIGSRMRYRTASEREAQTVLDAMMRVGAVFQTTENQTAAEAIINGGPPQAPLSSRPPQGTMQSAPSSPVLNSFRFAISDRQSRELTAEINQIAQRILGRRLAAVNVTRSLPGDEDAYFDPNTGVIYIALQSVLDPRFNIRHEAVHALRQAGVMSQQEWAVLSRMAKTRWIEEYGIRERYGDLYRERFDIAPDQLEELMVEEAIADAMAQHAMKPPADDVVSRIFQRVRQFLRAVANMLAGRGFTTPEQILSSIETGGMAQRRQGTGQGRGFLVPQRQESRQSPLSSVPPDDGGAGGRFYQAQAATTAEDRAMAEFAGNINLSKIDAAEDIKDVLRDAAEKADGFIAARRGVVSHEQTKQLAEQLGMSLEQLLKRKSGQAFNDHEAYAARAMLEKSAEIVKKAAARAKNTTSDVDRAYFARVLTRHAAIQEQVSGIAAEAGRALNQFKMMVGADYLRGVAEMLSEKTSRGNMGPEAIRDMAEMIDSLDTPGQVGRMARDMFKPRFLDMIREYYINSLLSGPATQTVNFMSNMLVALNQIPETFVAEQIGKLHGGDKVSRGETMARAIGLLEGSREGLQLAWMALKTGEPQSPETQFDQPMQKAIPGIAGEVIRLPSRLMMSSDEFFKAVNYRAELTAIAVRMAQAEGLDGDALADRILDLRNNPTPAMVQRAAAAGKYQTFQNKLGTKGQTLMRFRESWQLWWLLPFLRTPINILKYAAERSPIGPLLMSEVRQNLRGENGGAARDTQIARIALGTVMLAGMGAIVMSGMATGGGSDDEREKGVMRADGWQPYSLNIGGKYYSYLRFDPFSLHLGIVSDMVELRNKISKGEYENLGWMLMASIINNVTDKTWLKSATEFSRMTMDPKAYMENYLSHLASGFVPNFLAQIARAKDPSFRDARGVLDKIKERIPGLRETLPQRYDIFGEPITGEGNVGPDLFSPVYVSTQKNNPIARAMVDAKYFPGKPRRHINGHDLTTEQYAEYTQISGKEAVRRLERMVKSPSWSQRSQDSKERVLKRGYDQAREIARKTLMRKHPELRAKAEQTAGQ